MGDIFRRETAEHPEPFTGERMTAAAGGQVEIEHYHRYLFGRSLVTGLDVLDVASGEGYGSALLAQTARMVVGVEHSKSTVRNAASNFLRPNLHFVNGDAKALPLTDCCVDVVISFETIEHFDRHDVFLREVRRVLRPDGSFVVSTPDRDIYSPIGMPVNEYHVRELSRSEFSSLLADAFRHVQILQQRPLIGSALFADTGSPMPALVFDRRGDTHFEACLGLPRAPYLIAVASDREPSPLPPSLYIDRSDLDTEPQTRLKLTEQLHHAQAELAEAKRRMEAARRDLEQEARRAERAKSTCAEWEERSEALQREYDALHRQYDLLRGSLHTFLRGYLPRLGRHLFGQRP